MRASRVSIHQAADESPSLVQLTNEMTRLLESGSDFDLDAFVDLHPEHAQELRRLYPTIRGMVAFGKVSSDDVDAAGATEEPFFGVLGDFRIIREVGRGGMGVVYEAEQISLNRRVALKILPLAAVLDPRQLQRFKTEAQAAALLHHQNIVPIHGVGSERSVHFYAMQFVEGHTLADVIGDLRRNATPRHDGHPGVQSSDIAGQLTGASPRSDSKTPSAADATADFATPGRSLVPASQIKRDLQAAISTERSVKSVAYFRNVADVGIQVAEALEHAHEQGVVHRDIKPSNLIVDARGKVWVTDFGLARIESDASLTMTGDMIGTLRYMSPEQALAKRVSVDHRTDIYSLGVTLYELLTLQPAFAGNDRQQVLRQIAFEEPRAPTKVNRAVPSELETIVIKAMAKNPDERYSTAGDLAEDLRLYLANKPIKARRPTSVQRTDQMVETSPADRLEYRCRVGCAFGARRGRKRPARRQTKCDRRTGVRPSRGRGTGDGPGVRPPRRGNGAAGRKLRRPGPVAVRAGGDRPRHAVAGPRPGSHSETCHGLERGDPHQPRGLAS